MPQDRTLLQQTDALTVERVHMHTPPSPQALWSPRYEVASSRLVLPASGATEFRMDGGASVLLDGLTALSLPAGLPYQMKPCVDAPRASIVVSARSGVPGAVSPDCAAWSLSPRALWLLRLHWRALARGNGESGPTRTLLQEVLRQSAPAWRGAGRTSAAVHRAQRFMAASMADRRAAPWTLRDVADAACCSPFHLARSFRRHTGLSLHGYRQRLRLALALQRLEEGECDLAALAHELGYSSQSHLGSAFLRELGVTPAQARRALAG